MIFYFTGTGNSLAAAKILARELNEPLISIAEAIQKNQYTYQLQPEEKVGFVFPVYYFGLPTIVREFAAGLTLTGGTDPYIFAVITCGGGIGAADKKFAKALSKRGLTIRVVFEILTVDNYVLLYDMPSPDAQETVLAAADKKAQQIAAAIKEGSVSGYTSNAVGTLTTAVTYPIYRYGRRTSKFYADSKCISCGFCVNRCPAGAIKMVNDRPRWIQKQCIHCLGCIHRCPTAAIQYGKGTANRRRFVNPALKSKQVE